MGLWRPPVTLDNPGFTVWPCTCAKLTQSFRVSLEPMSRGVPEGWMSPGLRFQSHTRGLSSWITVHYMTWPPDPLPRSSQL